MPSNKTFSITLEDIFYQIILPYYKKFNSDQRWKAACSLLPLGYADTDG